MNNIILLRQIKHCIILALLVISHSSLAESMRIPRTSPGLVVDTNKGSGLYTENCASCHGTDLKGTKHGPPMLHRVYVPSHHSDISFQFAVQNGVSAHHWPFGDMQAIPGLTPDDVAHITAFVRAEQRKAGFQ